MGVIATEKHTIYQEVGSVDAAMAYHPVAEVAPQAETIAARTANQQVPVKAPFSAP